MYTTKDSRFTTEIFKPETKSTISLHSEGYYQHLLPLSFALNRYFKTIFRKP